MPQFKPGEVEIVRKVLHMVESAARLAAEDKDQPWYTPMDKFQLNILEEIKSLESVKEKWRPTEEDEEFWFIKGNGTVGKGEYWKNSACDKVYLKIGNCFPDKASCEVAAAKFIKMLED